MIQSFVPHYEHEAVMEVCREVDARWRHPFEEAAAFRRHRDTVWLRVLGEMMDEAAASLSKAAPDTEPSPQMTEE